MKIYYVIICLIFLFNIYSLGGKTLEDTNRKKDKLSKSVNDKGHYGQVVPLIKSIINSGTDADFNGIIKYVAAVGDILKPEITDMNGKVIEPGSPVLILDPQYLQGLVAFNQKGVKIAEDNLANAEINLTRNKKLIKGHEISEKEYQNYLNSYYNIKNNLNQAKDLLLQSKQFLRGCFLTAPFECIVDSVLLPSGMAAGQPPAIVISQLNPIGIKVKLTREMANSIKPETTIKIYSMRQEKPVGVIRGNHILKDDGIIFQIENKLEYGNKIKINGVEIPIIKRIGIAQLFNSGTLNILKGVSENLLGVPSTSIFEDKQGKFLWKGVGVKHMLPEKGITSSFKIQKVYVDLANMRKKIAGNCEIVALKNNKNLQEFDIIITEKIVNLKNNSLIYFTPERYIFMPGDDVKIVIEN